MIDLVIAILASAVLAFPVTLVLGALYLAVAIWIVNVFRLNYGEKPSGFTVLNIAVLLTIISYFVVFAIALRRF